jgi:hypothetical protein
VSRLAALEVTSGMAAQFAVHSLRPRTRGAPERA